MLLKTKHRWHGLIDGETCIFDEKRHLKLTFLLVRRTASFWFFSGVQGKTWAFSGVGGNDTMPPLFYVTFVDLNMHQLPPPDVILEDGAVLVLNKPGGLLTQGPPGIDSLELRTKSWLKVRDEKPGKVYLGVPHRLDRPVSGIITMVKNVRAADRISKQIQQRSVTKTYFAWIAGKPKTDSGIWTDFMRKVPGEARSELVDVDHPDAKQADLKFQVVDATESRSLLRIELITGRTHQIRLQCGARGHAIAGDELYGSEVRFGPETMDQRKRWIALHARRLAFEHPISHQPVDQKAPFPDWWTQELPAIESLAK